MSYVIAEPCITRAVCVRCRGLALCPVEAVQQPNGFAYIDPALCIECGLCEAECPLGVVHATEPVFARGRWRRMLPRNDWVIVARNRAGAG